MKDLHAAANSYIRRAVLAAASRSFVAKAPLDDSNYAFTMWSRFVAAFIALRVSTISFACSATIA